MHFHVHLTVSCFNSSKLRAAIHIYFTPACLLTLHSANNASFIHCFMNARLPSACFLFPFVTKHGFLLYFVLCTSSYTSSCHLMYSYRLLFGCLSIADGATFSLASPSQSFALCGSILCAIIAAHPDDRQTNR